MIRDSSVALTLPRYVGTFALAPNTILWAQPVDPGGGKSSPESSSEAKDARASLASLELSGDDLPPPGSTGWAQRIVLGAKANVPTYRGNVNATDESRIIS